MKEAKERALELERVQSSGDVDELGLVPGRSALAEGAGARLVEGESAVFFERACGEARAAIAKLGAATVRGDRVGATAAASGLRQALRTARAHASAAGIAESPRRREQIAELDAEGECAIADWRRSAAFCGTETVFDEATPLPSGGAGAGTGALPHEQLDPRASALRMAAFGVSGPGEPLPFEAELQARFGRHDLSGVRAHTGGEASHATRAFGARAYAFGNNIAFDATPTLDLVAHEAAHVVQQRGGVALKDSIDTPGDVYEQHADAVADAVVRGDSAEPLLDEMAGAGGASSAVPTIQRNTQPSPTTGGAGVAPPVYIHRYAGHILGALDDRLVAYPIPDPHPRLRWVSALGAPSTIARAIRAFVGGSPEQTLKRLMELAQPADLFALVESHLRRPGASGWRPEIGAAIAAAFDEPIHASVLRMGPRVRARMDTQTELPSAATIVVSCPLDRVVVQLLVDPHVVDAGPKQRGGGIDDTPGQTFEHGPRHVTYEWQGARDKALWNWIRVKSPADATVEDVAHIPFLGREVLDSDQAYRIAASPPFFGIPFETAGRVPEAIQHAPFDVQRQIQLGDAGPRYADHTALAQSAVSDDAVFAQAPKGTKDDLAPERSLERIQLQLGFVEERLRPWGAARPVVPAQRFIARRTAEVAGDARKAPTWRAALAAQDRALVAITSELSDVLGELAANNVRPDPANLGPVARVLEAYARAAGVSHLAGDAEVALAEALRMRGLLPLAIAEDRIRVAGDAVAAQQQTQQRLNLVEPGARSTIAALPDLAARSAQLRLAALGTGAVDPELVDELAADADLTNLRARIVTLQTQVHAVEKRADAVGITDRPFQQGLPTLRAFANAYRKESATWLQALEDRGVTFAPAEGLRSERHRRTERKRRLTKDVERQLVRFKDLGGIGNADNYFAWAQRQIADEELRDLVNSVALQLGVMIATGQLAGAAFAALRSASVGATVVSGLRGAGTIFKAGELVANAAAMTGVQAAMTGQGSRRAFAENLLAGALASAAMRPFRGLFQQSGALEREVQTFARTVARGGTFVAEMAIDGATSLAAIATARMMIQGASPSAMGSADWMAQAIAFAASRFVHHQVQKVRERLKTRVDGDDNAARKELTGLAEVLHKQSGGTRQPSSDEAVDAIARYVQLLRAERALHQDRAARDPNEVARMRETDADLNAFGHSPELAIDLARLTPVVNGAVYQGTAATVQRAVEIATRMGIDLAPRYNEQTRLWLVRGKYGTIVIHDVAPAATVPAGVSAGSGPRAASRSEEQQRAAATPGKAAGDADAPTPETTAARARTSFAQRKDALKELATIPVATASGVGAAAGHRDAYYVTRADGVRMHDLFTVLAPEVQVRDYKNGLLVRRGNDEWYFEYHDAQGATHASLPRAGLGLPAPNVGTVEIWGFRGVRTIHGRPEPQWTPAERAKVADIRQDEQLMWAGHVGVSFDGGKSIIGFTPKGGGDQVVKGLLANEAYPGQVRDDTHVFRLAERCATELGWNTTPVRAVEVLDRSRKAAIEDRVDDMMRGNHGLGYSFPLRELEGGKRFKESNGFKPDDIRNCATFPDAVGLRIPDGTGLLKSYMPALEGWASQDGPIEARTTAE